MRLAIQKLLSNTQVNPYEVSTDLYQPRDNYNLDPMQAAVLLGSSPEIITKLAEDVAYRQSRLNRTVDEGALMLDQLMGSNLSGVRKPPTSLMQIAPDATYKIQPREAPRSVGGPATDLEFIRLMKTPMMDWDKPDAYHMDKNVTVRNLGDVEDMARSYVKDNPQSMMKIYLTPGGYRAWEMGESMTPTEFQPRFESLNVDPGYAFLSVNPNQPDTEGFASRISAKPGRVDWAAQPLTVIKGEDAQVNPRSKLLIDTLHDDPIRQAYLRDGLGASANAIAALKQELPGVSKSMAKEMIRRFKL